MTTALVLPQYPCNLVGRGPGGSLSFSRWKGEMFLSAFGVPGTSVSVVLAGLSAQGVQLAAVDDQRWRVSSEGDARLAMQWLISHWPDVARVELNLVAPGLPGACTFLFDLTRGPDDVHLNPELEFHRDQQRARIPQTEAWLLELLKAPEYDAKPVWDAEWQVSRARMMRLLQGPMDPFERAP